MNRRSFLGAGAAIGAAATAPALATATSGAPATVSEAHRLADVLKARFRRAPLHFTPVARADRNRLYVTLTTTARDNTTRQKIGGGWFYDLDAKAWTQQKPWVSPDTETQYRDLVGRAQGALAAIV